MPRIYGIADETDEEMRILYDSKKIEYKTPFGALASGSECNINIKIPVSCEAGKVYICMKNDNTDEEKRFLMQYVSSSDDYDKFATVFSLDSEGLWFYHFFISTPESEFELFKYGYDDTNIGVGERWQLTCYPRDFSVPAEFCGKVMYQIFPDRFYREELEDTKDKLTPFYIHSDTEDIPDFLPDQNGKILNCDFYGGNLKGIIRKLDYIKSLGTSVIYLNPIFMAYSNHRYDTCDYKRIDPLLGDESDFVNLCDEAHRRGMKIILDGVFSHTGSKSIYFDKENIFGSGAYSCDNSPYKSWFVFGSSKDDYESWWGIDTLPCVNELSEDYIKYIITDTDSVVAKWLRLGADGYRLDVADELPDEFIKKLRDRVKEIKPDSFVVGEVWEDASNKISYNVRQKYFSDGELDSVMNYVFKNAIISYVTGDIGSADFAKEIMTIAENYPEASLHSLMNSLSTHDTERILTRLSDERAPDDKMIMANSTLSEAARRKSVERLYIAVLLQYTLPGTACIYYGDEIGMEGYGDPFNRGYFKWDKSDVGIFEFFGEMGRIKNLYKSLQTGKIEFVRCDDVMIFDRYTQDERLRIVINKSDNEIALESGELVAGHRVSFKGGRVYVQSGGFGTVKF